MEIIYPNSGRDYLQTDAQKAALQAAIGALTWEPATGPGTLPMHQGLGLRHIQETVGGISLALAYGGSLPYPDGEWMETYGLLALETRFKNAVVKHYWLDKGSEVICLRTDVTYTREGNA